MYSRGNLSSLNLINQQLPELKDVPVANRSAISSASIDSDSIHNNYFYQAEINGLNKTQGVVATPMYIADFMVKECLSQQSKNPRDITWLDPCGGSGIFPESILKEYFTRGLIKSISDLPRLTINEISSFGISCIAEVIKKLLEQNNLNISDYLNSGRLNLNCIDSLSAQPERVNIFSEIRNQYDIVIGNPPYIRASRIETKYKDYLKGLYPGIYSGTSDLYYYFISSGIASLSNNGTLCFISPANFFRAASAKKLRSFLKNKVQVSKVIDLDELKVFANADIHSAIYTLKKRSMIANSNTSFLYSHLKANEELSLIKNNTIVYESLPASNVCVTGWKFLNEKTSKLDISQSQGCHSLTEAGFRIVSGVRPGVKNAYLYSLAHIKHIKTDIREKWFVPCIPASKITRWSTVSQDAYLLLLTHDCITPPNEIMDLLIPFKDKLASRYEVEKVDSWYKLRSCSYYEVFRKPRIVFPDICRKLRFSFQEDSNFILDGAFAIETDNLAILGILNSELAYSYFVNHCASIGNALNKGRIRLKKGHVEKFPIPKGFLLDKKSQSSISDIVKQILKHGESEELMSKLNEVVHTLYFPEK